MGLQIIRDEEKSFAVYKFIFNRYTSERKGQHKKPTLLNKIIKLLFYFPLCILSSKSLVSIACKSLSYFCVLCCRPGRCYAVFKMPQLKLWMHFFPYIFTSVDKKIEDDFGFCCELTENRRHLWLIWTKSRTSEDNLKTQYSN